jgi:hypothetical protein
MAQARAEQACKIGGVHAPSLTSGLALVIPATGQIANVRFRPITDIARHQN